MRKQHLGPDSIWQFQWQKEFFLETNLHKLKKAVWWAAKSSTSISHNLVCFQLVEVDNLLQTIETQNRSLLNPMHFQKMLHCKRNVLLCFAQIEQLLAHFWGDIF